MFKLVCIALAAVVVVALAHPAHEQKTTVEVKERVDQYPGGNVRTQSGTVTHDVVGGKNWGAGGYVTHERREFPGGFRDKNTHGGLQVNARW